MVEDWQFGGFGLYIHWPFCQSKCPYCDFNSHVAAGIDQRRWRAAYLAEIDRLGRETQGRTLDTIFFGGGTPSLMDPDLVAALIERCRATWPMRNDPEITLEANPGSVEAARFRDFRTAGVSRVSMGIQALNDEDLRRLGRLHSVSDALRAFDIARATFSRVSFDLIYARQHQDLGTWRDELKSALALAVDHLSLYQLTIEPETAFGARHAQGKLRGLPDEDLAADLYACTQDLCGEAGLPAYEVSNHARDDSQSRHNLIYWRAGDYGGIGPGAHGRLTLGEGRWATVAPSAPSDWLRRVESGAPGEIPRDMLTGEDRALEYLLMSMRLTEGLEQGRYTRMSNRPIDPTAIADLVQLGLVTTTGDRLAATQQGRAVLNGVIRKLAGA